MLDNVFSLTSTMWTTPAFWAALSLAAMSLFSVVAFKLTRSSVSLAWIRADKHAPVQAIENTEKIVNSEETSDTSEEIPSWLHAITDEDQVLADRLSNLPSKVQAPQNNLSDEVRRWLEMVENLNPRLDRNSANRPTA